jgi:hypothetical protein
VIGRALVVYTGTLFLVISCGNTIVSRSFVNSKSIKRLSYERDCSVNEILNRITIHDLRFLLPGPPFDRFSTFFRLDLNQNGARKAIGSYLEGCEPLR